MSGVCFPAVLLSLGALVLSSPASAQCNAPSSPFVSPVNGVTLHFSPYESDGIIINTPVSDGARRVHPPVAGPSVSEMVDRPFDSKGGRVIYIESDGRGGRRICRSETWVARSSSSGRKEMGFSQAGIESVPGHARLNKIFSSFRLDAVHEVYYDGRGRLSEVRLSRPAYGAESLLDARNYYLNRLPEYCVRYTDAGLVHVSAGRLGGFVSLDETFQCTQLGSEPSKVGFDEFSYTPDGRALTILTKTPTHRNVDGGESSEFHVARDGGWWGQGLAFFDSREGSGDGEGVAQLEFSELHGLKSLSTWSSSIVPADKTSVFEYRKSGSRSGVTYDFTAEPVPVSVLEGEFDGLVAYSRIRTYSHRNGMKIHEIFAPNASTPVERQWRALDLSRQENYDDSGKLKRVILFGRVPSNGYSENLRAYAEQGVLKVTPITSGYSSYRVYDYDAAGNETLSLVCWRHDVPSNKPYAHFPWWEADPRPKRGREAELQYGMKSVGTRCGTPDGKMIIEGMGPIKKMMETNYGFGTTKLKREDR